MVGAHDVRHYECLGKIWQQILRYEKIVDPPANVPLSSPAPSLPPCVLFRFPVKMSKCIDKTMIDKSVYPFSLYRQKSRYFLVCLRMCQVYFLMSRVNVATDNKLFTTCYHRFDQFKESFIKLHFIS